MRYIKPLFIAIIIAFILVTNINAQSFSQSLCSGTGSINGGGGSGGIIPANDVLSGQVTGKQNIILMSLLIMLIMLLITSVLYMLSYVLNLDLLKNLAKAEMGEVIITVIIIFVFFGFFNFATAGTAGYAKVGRGLYVDDCTYISNTSIALFVPFLFVNFIRWLSELITSLQITIEPAFFGFSFSPLTGYNLFDTVLGILDDMTGAIIVVLLGTLLLLGLIFALFPLFLYAGIILRTLPWTRAAGGAFLGLFVGFYIVFPLLLHVFLSGYAAGQIPISSSLTENAVSGFAQTSDMQNTGSTYLSTTLNFFSTEAKQLYNSIGTSVTLGLINGYIYYVLEPAALALFAVIISFMVSFEFAELTGDLLGAPSLSTSGIFNKVLG